MRSLGGFAFVFFEMGGFDHERGERAAQTVMDLGGESIILRSRIEIESSDRKSVV